MNIAFYSSKPTQNGRGIPTFAFTIEEKDGKGGEFDRFRIQNDSDHVEISIRGNVKVEQNYPDQTIIRLQDSCGDFIVRQR